MRAPMRVRAAQEPARGPASPRCPQRASGKSLSHACSIMRESFEAVRNRVFPANRTGRPFWNMTHAGGFRQLRLK